MKADETEVQTQCNKNDASKHRIQRSPSLERRATIPIELDFPEDCTISDADPETGESFVIGGQASEVSSSEQAQPSEPDGRFLHTLPKEARNILAGGTAGIVAKSVVAPVDRIKIMYQISAAPFRILDVPKVAKNIVETEGVRALWKGNTAAMIRVFPYSGIQFMVYDFCKQFFIERRQESDLVDVDYHGKKVMQSSLLPVESLLSGMTAGSVSVLCTYPLDLTRAQLAVVRKTSDRSSHSFVGMMTENVRQRGVKGLYRGITPTMLGIFPYSGLAFALNEQGKRQIHQLFGREVTTIERMQCGAFAGLIAQTVTYPIEVTRRRMQTVGLVGINNDSALTSLGCSGERPTKPPSLKATIVDLYKEQGMRGFLKGVTMNWIKGPIAFSISFTTYDTVQKFMETSREREQRRW